MKILLFCKYDSKGASSRVRCLQYIPYLNLQGIEVDINYLYSNKMLASTYSLSKKSNLSLIYYVAKRIALTGKVKNYDLIWVQKEFLPNVPFWLESFFLRKAKRIILDIDDAEYLKYRVKPKSWFLRHKYKKIARRYNLVVAGNKHLARQFSQWGGQTTVIPTVVDSSKYQCSQPARRPIPLQQKDVLVLGWIGSPFTQSYVLPVINPIEKFAKESGTRVILRLVGASKSMAEHSKLIELAVWSEDSEVEYIGDFDVGLMPLPPGHWSEGKCSFKAIQCMALGKPVIVSPTLANIELVREPWNGFIARSEDEWYDALVQITKSARVSNPWIGPNTERIKNRYSVESQLDNLIATFYN